MKNKKIEKIIEKTKEKLAIELREALVLSTIIKLKIPFTSFGIMVLKASNELIDDLYSNKPNT